MKIAVVPFAVIQRHRNQSLDAKDYLGNLHERERAMKNIVAARKRIADALAALHAAQEIEELQKAEGISVST